jgi:SIR2-like domain
MSTETATPPSANRPKNRGLDEATWKRLLARIDSKPCNCTPVIGSGACTAPPIGANPEEWGKLGYPTREQISLEFATEYGYPLEDQKDLERVAKYVAAMNDMMAPKEAYSRHFKDLPDPKFSEIPSEPHRVLAGLPFEVYLTSNFDNWMFRALKDAKRDAQLALCRWNKHIPEDAPSFDGDFQYSVANPLVYHFHGCTPWAESAVVTEDDYFEFLINISRDYKASLAHRVDRATAGALLFLGYTLADWDFLVLFRLFANKLRESGTTHIAVQLEPCNAPGSPLQNTENAINYLNSYFGSAKIKVYWGTCQEFCHELRTRWETFKGS